MTGRSMVCYAAGRGDPCDAARQAHHHVKQQRIRRVWATLNADYRRGRGPRPWSLRKALDDRRNLVYTCYRHHKEETAMPLPVGFWEFVAEYKLVGVVPRHLQGEVPPWVT